MLKSSVITLIIASLCSVSAPGQDKRPMTLVDLLEVPTLSDPRLSPDGRQVLFELSRSDWEENRQIPHIWRIQIDGSGAIRMTNGPDGDSDPRWSPDGTWIAFLSKRGSEQRQIFLIRNDGGEAESLTKHETSVSSHQWAPSGDFLYFLADDPESEEEKQKKKAKDDVAAFDEDYKQRHLWRISLSTRESKRISEGDFSILSFRVSRDGARIAFQRAPTPLYDNEDEGEVWLMAADGGNAVQLTDNGVAESQAQLSPDGTHVLFLADANAEFESYYNANLFLVPAGGGESYPLMPEFPYEVLQASWGGDGDAIFLVANTGVESQLFRISRSRKDYHPLTSGKHALRGWHYQPSLGSHVFSLDQPRNPGDIWILTEDQVELVQVSRVFEYLDQQFLLPRQERIEWKGSDGVTVEGLLIPPLSYEEGRSCPLVVQTHGGPASSDRFGFGGSTSRYNPVLAAKGYAVFRPNYRGSTGYGNEFLRDMVGHYFQNAHLDVMRGVDLLIERGIADPEKMVKMGWSAGGHMTNKIITFTDRFKAASSGAGAVNWISMYGQSDVRIYRTPWFGGTPWQEGAPIDIYWGNSPLREVWKVKTPTLVLVGENDVRVPPPQSVELYRALRSNGVPTRLYVAPREPHGWRELRHRLFKMNVELEWFARYALGEEYTWEKAPEKGKTVEPPIE